jgi:integrase
LYQKPDDVRNLGEDAAPWLVGWYEPDGRRKSKTCGAGPRGKKTASRLAAKITAQLMTGTYQQKTTVLWDDFVNEYDRRILAGLEPTTRAEALLSLGHFARLVKPVRVYALDASHIDDFAAKRRKEPGRKGGETLSPATLNKDLRHVRAALNVAVEWGYLTKAPRFRMERTARRIPRYVTPEHFALIYDAAGAARLPRDLPYLAADWWRGILLFAYMTGWRVGDLLGLRRADVDLERGYAITRAEVAKADRDDMVKLHPVLVEHLAGLAAFDPMMFPWHHNRRTLDDELDRLQAAAGIKLPCAKAHEHTDACHVYSWHDFRRAFATLNAGKLGPDALQALMRHKSYATTQVYISLARQVDEAVNKIHVPEVARRRPATR